MKFDYPEDEEFFADILCDGDTKALEHKFKDYFDFRDPVTKRNEFNLTSKKICGELKIKYEGKCQLRLSPKCEADKNFQVDHIIPLSSNKLNKEIRKIKGPQGKKTSTQSFGSNHPKNLILSCSECNSFKMNKIIPFRKTTNGIKFL